jgi:hypothetical protein
MYRSWPGSRVAAAGLILANAVPLVGVAAFGWDLHSLLVVYWLESGAVGVATVAKIRRAEGDDGQRLPSIQFDGRSIDWFVGRGNLLVAGVFVVHYGLFWFVHGVFVLFFPLFFPDLDPASPAVVAVAAVGLAAYHAVSYRANYIEGGEYERTGPVTLMTQPYRRVFVLHLTVVLGAFGVAGLGAPIGALIVMVLVKTALDLWGHWKEHERARRRPPSNPTAE